MNVAPDLNPFRPTIQRQVMLEELAKANHPTACELYELVRRRLHRIGLGTVYRNLELMAASGVIIKLEVGGSQKRYDADIEPHYHIRCCRCDKVENIDMHVIQDIIKAAAKKTAYNIIGHHIEFSGECPQCQRMVRHVSPPPERSLSHAAGACY